jgi:ornithine--oxo-acid transaminase/putrescine aminotransferase
MLEAALGGSPLLEEIRGVGLMLGVALKPLDHPWLQFEHFGFQEADLRARPTIAPLVCHRLYRRGFFAFTCGHDWRVLRLQPRFEIPLERLGRLAEGLREELDHLQELAA